MANSFFNWPTSLSRFIKLDTVRAEDVNSAFDEVAAGLDDVEALTNAAVKLPAGETAAVLPVVALRKGKLLGFNAYTGAAEAIISTEFVVDQVSLAADQVALATAQAIQATNNGAAQVSLAADQAELATQQRMLADSAAASAVNAPGTNATSTSLATVTTGVTSIIIQAGKAFVVGMVVQIASTASPTNYMNGVITAYNPATGVLIVDADVSSGSGTFTAWTVSLSAPQPTVLGRTDFITQNYGIY